MVETSVSQEDGQRRITQRLSYRYADHRIEREASEVIQSAERFASFYVGQPIPIRVIHFASYSFSEPDIIYQHLFDERGLLWTTAIAIDLFLAYVMFALWRQRLLISCGTPTPGRIISVDAKSARGRVVVHYEFGLPDGASQERRERMSMRRLGPTDRDRRVCVLYDPRRPRRSVIYELSWWRCEAS